MLQFRWSRVTAVGIFFLLVLTLLDAAGGKAGSSTKREVKIRNKREGSWSGWSSWSPCSRTCGGGIRTQTRQCQIRRGRGGGKPKDILEESKLWKNVSSRHCEGHATRHHLCSVQECPKGSIDFRESQCKAFDNRPFMGKVYQWEAFIDERSPCSLTCRAKGFRFFATLNKTVIDGTHCKTTPSDFHVCISGTCTPIGCDGIAGSQRRMDRCGVCGGDNSTCRVISGIFTRPQLPVGYNMVAHIPKGACNLNITQVRRSPNYLALRTNDGAYILNGNWAINWPGEYEGAGAKFLYNRQDLKSFESIASPGPLREPIDLLVLYQQPNPGIKYEYMLPMNDSPIPPVPLESNIASHNHGRPQGGPPPTIVQRVPPPYSISSSGPGNLRSVPATNNAIPSFVAAKPSALSGSYTAADASPPYSISNSPVVPNVISSSSPVVAIQQQQPHPHLHNHHQHGRRRNHHHSQQHQHHRNAKANSAADDKKFYWKITAYSNCSEPCGGGTQKSIARCLRGANGVPVSDRRCPPEEKPAAQTIRCNLKPCPAEWITGSWSACSEACGPDGYQTRAVHCQQRISPTLTMRVAEGACILEKQPETKKPCFTKPCHRWDTTSWTECSASCGNGIRSRKVTCVNAGGDKIDAGSCEGSEKPLEISPCNMGPCQGVDWFTSEWSSECSQTCGSGYQSRHVVCGVLGGRRNSGSGSEETNLIEDDDDVKNVGDDGNDNDDHTSDASCDAGKRPREQRDCFTEKHCGDAAWFTGPWGQCSSSCGQGLKSRQVLCVLFNRGKFKVVEEAQCISGGGGGGDDEKPEEKMSCESSTSCPPRWFTTEWSECSVPCGGGTQRRSVSCRGSNWTLSSSSCIDMERPLDRRSCNENKCSNGMLKEDTPAPANIQAEPTARSSSGSAATENSSRSQTAPPTPPQQQPQQQQRQHHPNENEPNEEPDDSECTDQYRNCPLVVQARLCRYKYYRSVCCSACSDSWQHV